jgi:hypothetical protein
MGVISRAGRLLRALGFDDAGEEGDPGVVNVDWNEHFV